MDIKKLLEGVKRGSVSIEEAELELKKAPFVDIDFAKLDLHRSMRQGVAEVIYGESKTSNQIEEICNTLIANGQDLILITRLSEDKAKELSRSFMLDYSKDGRIAIIGNLPETTKRKVLIVIAGTSDHSVAEEAFVTLKALGNSVEKLEDVGVSGLHRLLSNLDKIMSASVIIVIAGMEGALASVIGGLVDVPVIAVPTSVGYGASFEGLAALLSMMNSCSSGVSVVNIDNGFGAGFLASRINHIGE